MPMTIPVSDNTQEHVNDVVEQPVAVEKIKVAEKSDKPYRGIGSTPGLSDKEAALEFVKDDKKQKQLMYGFEPEQEVFVDGFGEPLLPEEEIEEVQEIDYTALDIPQDTTSIDVWRGKEFAPSNNPAVSPEDTNYRNNYRNYVELQSLSQVEQLNYLNQISPAQQENILDGAKQATGDIAELAYKAGMPISATIENPDIAWTRANRISAERREITQAVNDEIKKNPDSIKVLQANFDLLDQLNRSLASRYFLKGDYDQSLPEKLDIAWNDRGFVSVDLSKYSSTIRGNLSTGQPIPDDVDRDIKNIMFRSSAGIEGGNLGSDMLVATATIIPALANSVWNGLLRGVTAGSAAAVVSSPFSPAVAIPSTVIAAKTGFGAGVAEDIFNQTYASSAYAYSQQKVNGKKLDPKVVNDAATIEAILSTSLDVAGMAVLGAAYKASAGAVHKIISNAIKTPAGAGKIALLLNRLKSVPGSKSTATNTLKELGNIVKTVGTATAVETATESTQSLIYDGMAELAKEWTAEKRGGIYETKPLFNPKSIDNAIEAGRQAMLATPILAGLPAGLSGISNILEYQNTIDNSLDEQSSLEQSRKAQANATNSETQSVINVLNQINTDNGIGTSFMDATDAQQVLNEITQNGIASQNTTWVTDVQTAIDKAVSKGGRVEINTVDMNRIVASESGSAFIDHITASEDTISTYRQEQDNAVIVQSIEDEIQQAAQTVEINTQIDEITKNIASQLTASGVLSRKSAKLLSKLIPTWIKVKANQSGISPADIIKDFSIEGLEDVGDLGEAQGQYDLDNQTVRLGESQDLSTFIHEAAHFFLDAEQRTGDTSRIEPMIPAIASELQVPEASINEVLTNPEDNPNLYEGIQEYFARSFESYILEGKTNSRELKEDAINWAEWLALEYKDGTPDLVTLDENARQVFDNMLSLEGESLADTNFSENVSDVSILLNEVQEAREANREARELRNQQQDNDSITKDIKAIYKRLKDATTELLKTRMKELEQRIDAIMADDKLLIARDLIDNSDLKLDRRDVKLILGTNKLPRGLVGRTVEDGFNVVDIMQEAGFFDDGNSQITPEAFIAFLVENKSNAKIKSELIKQSEADIIASIPTDEALLLTAEKMALENDTGNTLLIDQLNRDRLANNQRSLQGDAIKLSAVQELFKLKVSDIKPNIFKRRELKAAQDHAVAVVQGDIERQSTAAYQRALNAALFRESTKIKDNYKKIIKNFNRYKKKSRQQQVILAGGEYWTKIASQLARVGVLDQELIPENREAYNKWINLPDSIESRPPKVLSSDEIIDLKSLTYGEISAINDSIESIYTASTTANNVIVGDRTEQLSETIDLIVEEIEAHSKGIDKTHTAIDTGKKNWLSSTIAQATVIPWLLRTLTNPRGTAQSVTELAIDRPLVDAARTNNKLWVKFVGPLVNYMQKTKVDISKRLTDTVMINSLSGNKFIKNGVMTGNQLISFALNMGTENNLQTLMKGYRIIKADEVASLQHPVIQEILSKLTRSDWDFIELAWKQIDAMFPLIYKQEKEHFGRLLTKERGIKINTEFGEIQGMYYPLIRDRNIISEKEDGNANVKTQSAEELISGQPLLEGVSQLSATHERTSATYPVMLDVHSGMMKHFNEIIFNLSYYDAVYSINKIIKQEKFRKAFQKSAGNEQLKNLDTWLRETANQSRGSESAYIESIFRHVRRGMTLTLLGASIFKTVPKQLFGFLSSVGELSKVSEREFTGRWIKLTANYKSKAVKDKIQYMLEHSAIMNDRINLNSFDRDLQEMKTVLKSKDTKLSRWNEFAMRPIAFVQTKMVDTPIWIISHDISMDKSARLGVSEEQAMRDATAYADSVIERTQGSSGNKNLPFIIRSNRPEYVRSVTIFMTAMLALSNNIVSSVTTGKRGGSKEKYEAFLNIMSIVVVPAMVLTFINLMQADNYDDNESESPMLDEFSKQLSSSIAGFIPLGSAALSSVEGYDAELSTFATTFKGVKSLSKIVDKIIDDDFDFERDRYLFMKLGVSLSALLHIGGGNQILKTINGFLSSENDTPIQRVDQIMFGEHRDK